VLVFKGILILYDVAIWSWWDSVSFTLQNSIQYLFYIEDHLPNLKILPLQYNYRLWYLIRSKAILLNLFLKLNETQTHDISAEVTGESVSYESIGIKIIANNQSNRTTHSYIAFADSKRLIDDKAKSQTAMNAENTVFWFNVQH